MTSVQKQKTCLSCGTINRPDCRFCTGCGGAFPKERTCPSCNATLPDSQRFCNACGAPSDPSAQQQTAGRMKFCHQCRALISHNAKFCNMCGTVISNLPVCPRCGDPIGPEEKFCGVCGMPFTTAAPARQTPAQSVQTVAQQTVPQPVKTGGMSFGKIAAGIVVVLIVIVGIVMLLPDTATPPPGGGNGGTTTVRIIAPTGDNPAATKLAVDESQKLLSSATTSLANNDGTTFGASLSEQMTRITGTNPTLDAAGAAKLADALKNAKVVESYPNIVFYEMTLEGKTYSFYTAKEVETWKLYAL